jgi:hypothetical protein
MRFLVITSLLSALCVSMAASVLRADTMRCGGRLVSDGDTLYEVRSTCGEPVDETHRTEFRTVKNWVSGPCVQTGDQVRCGHAVERTVEVGIDEWTYDFGPHEFIRFLTFEQGKLVSIRTGDYGNIR